MATAINWPTAINSLVERDSYTIDPHDDNARTDFDDGPARTRRRFTTSRALFTLVWIMKAEEFAIFKPFYKYDLAQGALWFNVPIYADNAYTMREARFDGKYHAKNYGVFDWEVSAVLELRELPTFTYDEYYLVLFFGYDLADSFADRLDPIVNVAYPLAVEPFL